MSDPAQIEQEIRHLLATETNSIILSNKLFSPPNGLFCRLGPTQEARRAIIATPLFREAQERVSALMHKDAALFAEIVAQVESRLSPGSGLRFRMEPADLSHA